MTTILTKPVLCFLVLGLFASCGEKPEQPEQKQTVALRVTQDKGWTSQDRINVNGEISAGLDAGYSGKNSAEFNLESISPPYYVAYPASAVSVYDFGTADVTVPTAQNLLGGAYDRNAMLLLGKSRDSDVALHQAAAILHLKITGMDRITDVHISGAEDDALSGIFSTDYTSLRDAVSARNHVELSSTAGIALPAEVYAVVNPGRYGVLDVSIVNTRGQVLAVRDTLNATLVAGEVFDAGEIAFEGGTVPDPGPGLDPPETDSLFRVASYNILVNDGRRSEMALSYCSGAMGKAIKDCNADVICIQELDEKFAYRLPLMASNAGLAGYVWDVANPNQVTSSGVEYYYANGLAYNPEIFKFISGGLYWYTSDGRYTSSRSTAYDNHSPKYCNLVWTRLRHIPTGLSFYFISTHLPLSSDGTSSGLAAGRANYLCALALNSFVKTVSDPCIMGADLNASSVETDANAAGYSLIRTSWKDVYEELASAGKLDSYYLQHSGTMSGSSSKYYYTVDVYTKNHPERRYDHIMYRNGQGCSLEPVSYSTVNTGYYVGSTKFCPSDHLPITAQFRIR